MKKFYLLGIATLAALSLAACSSQTTTQDKAETSTVSKSSEKNSVSSESSSKEPEASTSSVDTTPRADDDTDVKTLLILSAKDVIQQKENVTDVKIDHSTDTLATVKNDDTGKSWLVTGMYDSQGQTHYFTVSMVYNENLLDRNVKLLNNESLTYSVEQVTVQ